jgi:hypothetical protein
MKSFAPSPFARCVSTILKTRLDDGLAQHRRVALECLARHAAFLRGLKQALQLNPKPRWLA